MGSRKLRLAMLATHKYWIVFRLEPRPDGRPLAKFTYSKTLEVKSSRQLVNANDNDRLTHTKAFRVLIAILWLTFKVDAQSQSAVAAQEDATEESEESEDTDLSGVQASPENSLRSTGTMTLRPSPSKVKLRTVKRPQGSFMVRNMLTSERFHH